MDGQELCPKQGRSVHGFAGLLGLTYAVGKLWKCGGLLGKGLACAIGVGTSSCAAVVLSAVVGILWTCGGLFGKGLACAIGIGASSCAAVVLSARIQRACMYLHWVPLPIFTSWLPFREWRPVDLRDLRAFRLVHFARTVEVATSDGELLQAWHAVPSRLAPRLAGRAELFDAALSSGPAIVFLHGQASTRGVYNRVELLRALAGQLQAHVLALDYRGFGGSSGEPSQEGLVQDVLDVWAWLGERRSAGVFLYGQSLGAAVALQVAQLLEAGAEGPPLNGVVLDAPFLSAQAAALRHPLYWPIVSIPLLRELLQVALRDRWESDIAVQNVRSPLLIFGAGRDGVVGLDGALGLKRAHGGESVELVVIEEAFHTNMYAYSEWLVALARFMG